jgi:hypothetical protein
LSPVSRIVQRAAVAVVLGCAVVGQLTAQTKTLDQETAQDVMRAGAAGVAGLDAALAGLSEARAIASKMASDAAFAQKVLDLARRNDLAGLTALIKSIAPRSGLQVTEVRDFLIVFAFAGGWICVSNEGGCNGKNLSVRIN